MTIAAGFRCRGAIIFGADTHETVGDYIHDRVHKIPCLNEPYCTAMITGSCGDGHLMDAAIERIFDAIREAPPTDYPAFGHLLRQVLVSFYGEDIYALPDKSNATVALLIAATLPTENSVEAWSTRSSVVRRMRDREVIGMGSIIQYVLEHLYLPDMPVEDAALAMIQLLAMAKKRVNFVGGDCYIDVLSATNLSEENVSMFPEQEETIRILFIDRATVGASNRK